MNNGALNQNCEKRGQKSRDTVPLRTKFHPNLEPGQPGVYKTGFVETHSCQTLTSEQCCGAGAGGAEIIQGPGAGAENKFK